MHVASRAWDVRGAYVSPAAVAYDDARLPSDVAAGSLIELAKYPALAGD